MQKQLIREEEFRKLEEENRRLECERQKRLEEEEAEKQKQLDVQKLKDKIENVYTSHMWTRGKPIFINSIVNSVINHKGILYN